MIIATQDRIGDRHYVAAGMDLEVARDTVRDLVSQGRDFGLIRQASSVTIWARHEPEKANRWWVEKIERGFRCAR